MSYVLSILCMIFWFVTHESNYLFSGMALIAASIFWFAGNYFYKEKIDHKEKEIDENV